MNYLENLLVSKQFKFVLLQSTVHIDSEVFMLTKCLHNRPHSEFLLVFVNMDENKRVSTIKLCVNEVGTCMYDIVTTQLVFNPRLSAPIPTFFEKYYGCDSKVTIVTSTKQIFQVEPNIEILNGRLTVNVCKPISFK